MNLPCSQCESAPRAAGLTPSLPSTTAGWSCPAWPTTRSAWWCSTSPCRTCLGQALLEQITAHDPDLPTIVLTATHDLETAVQCMQAGALDYLVKPVDTHRLVAVRASSPGAARPARGGELPRAGACQRSPAPTGSLCRDRDPDTTMHALFRYAAAIAQSPQPVLITGETGTGRSCWRAPCISWRRPAAILWRSMWRASTIRCSRTPCLGIRGGAFTGARPPPRGPDHACRRWHPVSG